MLTKILDRQARLRQGHELIMLNDANQMMKANRDRTQGQETSKIEDDTLQLGDSTGDTTTINNSGASAAVFTAVLLSALLGGAGLGTAFAMWLDQPTESPSVESIDTDTTYEFGLGYPKP